MIKVAPNNTATHRLAAQLRSVVTTPYEIWVSKDGSDSVGNGSILSPYLTLAKAVSVMTSTRKNVMILPGIYTSAASIAVPVGITDMLFTGLTSDYESTTIRASAGDEVFKIIPNTTIGAANVLIFFANMYISGASGVNGVQMTNTNMTSGKKLIVTFREVGFGADLDTDKSINMTHTDTDSKMKLYMHGRGMGGVNIEGLVYLDMQDAGDRFKVNGMNFEGGVQGTTTGSVAAELEYNACIMKLSGGSGGNAAHIVNANGCVSRSGAATQAAAIKGDFCTNGTYTDMSFS